MLKLSSLALATVMAFSSSLYLAVPENSRLDVIAGDCLECGSDTAAAVLYGAYTDIDSYSGVSWVKSGSKWYCKDSSGNYIKDTLADIGGTVYYFDTKGVMKTGWQQIDSRWYYFASSGAMKTGWQKISKKWYYFNASGIMLRGIQRINGMYYYFGEDGAMKTGWQQFRGDWFYFTSSGEAKVSTWFKSGKVWYYFGSGGVMATGLDEIDGSYYLFNDSGAMLTGWQQYEGEWYYLASSGAAVSGWKTVGGKEYCFDETGMMLHDTVVDGLILDSDGHVVGAAATSPAAGTSPAASSETAPASGTTPAAETSPATVTTPAAETTYDPDCHGGYWIEFPSKDKITSASELTTTCRYVCHNGNIITYNQYNNMNWAMKNDPKFGAYASSTNYYRGTWWMQGPGNTNESKYDDTLYVASWITWDIGGKDAFAYDGHVGSTPIVGSYCNSGKQTWGYTGWNGNAVTNNEYSKWASAMDAYKYNYGRHDKAVCERYGIAWNPQTERVSYIAEDGSGAYKLVEYNHAETLGDYIMIEWCEGNFQYNMKTLPVPDFMHYAGMGSTNYELYFTTCDTLSSKFPVSREWDFSNRSANVVSDDELPVVSPTTAAPTTRSAIDLPFVPAGNL